MFREQEEAEQPPDFDLRLGLDPAGQLPVHYNPEFEVYSGLQQGPEGGLGPPHAPITAAKQALSPPSGPQASLAPAPGGFTHPRMRGARLPAR